MRNVLFFFFIIFTYFISFYGLGDVLIFVVVSEISVQV